LKVEAFVLRFVVASHDKGIRDELVVLALGVLGAISGHRCLSQGIRESGANFQSGLTTVTGSPEMAFCKEMEEKQH